MGMLSRVGVVLVLLASGGVAAVGSSPGAAAAPVPCTRTFEQGVGGMQVPPGSTNGSSLHVPDVWTSPQAAVTDVDARVVVDRMPGGGGSFGGLQVRLVHLTSVRLFSLDDQAGAGGTVDVDLVLDDEAEFRPPYVTTGRYRPDGALAAFDGRPAEGEWSFVFVNQGADFIRPISVAVTITTADCDTDGDGLPDRRDNCPAIANPDQLDWDADGRGNTCDDTPGTAPAPPVVEQPQPPAPACTASCAYPRTVGLRLVKKHRLKGTVTSSAVGCARHVAVTLWQKRTKADRRLVVLTTRTNGSFRTRAPRTAGRYYVTVGSAAEPLCGSDRSRAIRLRRH